LLAEEQLLLSDQQLQDASFEKLQDLIARVDLLLSKGQPGLSLHPQKMSMSSQSLPIPQTREETQVSSAPSSTLCPERT
jgi:hypothetical protein